ncbi:MAG: aconitate hydratase [Desulfohalobiaceae bacterium]|nr:aconitate hydratase [Desulfohalobiaceae bacterium]
MGQTLTEKLIGNHLVEGEMKPGQDIGIRIDQTLTQDATGTMVYLAFDSLDIPRVQTELSVSYVDHNIIQTDYKNADDHRFLQSTASKYGAILSPPGNGVSHHVHRERFGIPGKSLLGSDSHTTTGGCLGMLAIGAGGLDVALAMAGKPFHLTMPRVWGIYCSGTLQPWVSGKDVILELLRRFSVKGGLGKIIEFYGPGVENLDMSARGTIANMGVDIGATALVFPSDRITRQYLKLQSRENHWQECRADPDARYDEVTELDLSTLEPLVACPFNPDNVKPAAELGDVELSQVIVGSSTNGSYRDIMMAAKIVKDRRVSVNISFDVNPGSRQAMENVARMGGMLNLFHSGARVHQAGCLGCIGMGQVPATGTNSLRTFPRNFKGRSGLQEDRVYLCSPETAAVSAIHGRITDPRTFGRCPEVPFPDIFTYSEDWFVNPAPPSAEVEIQRGPNIKPMPRFEEIGEEIRGEILLKTGDNISTDHILPGGNRILPLRSNIPAISEYTFEALDENFPDKARQKGGGIIVGGENYGQGSSREHAALAPRYLGVRAKIAKSFARIHKANLVNYGIVPLEFEDTKDYDKIQQGQSIEIPDTRKALREGRDTVKARVDGQEMVLRIQLNPREREILVAGGALNWTRQGLQESEGGA